MATASNLLAFRAQSAPVSLTEKYRPATLSEFCGIAKPKEILQRLAERPYSSSWIFRGESGTGKTTAAMALADAIPAQLQHVASQRCNVAEIERVWSNCFYHPEAGKRFWLNLVDEADQMSPAAQNALLSKLDGTEPTPDTIWIFTCNDSSRFEPRFLSRSRVLEFSNYGIQKDAVELLTTVWNQEAPGKTPPNLARIIKEANGNCRATLMALELELMLS
jgi:putative ATPase